MSDLYKAGQQRRHMTSYLEYRLRRASEEMKQAATELMDTSPINAKELSGAADMIDSWITDMKKLGNQ